MQQYADDTILFNAFLLGDAGAEHVVFHQFFSPLCLYAERTTGRMDAAKDIVLECLEKAFRHSNSELLKQVTRGSEPAFSWLFELYHRKSGAFVFIVHLYSPSA